MGGLPLTVPTVWDEQLIVRDLGRLSTQSPSAALSYFSGIKERFILRQEDHTAKQRLQWLKTKAEELKLSKDVQTAAADLMLVGAEQGLRAKKLALEHGEVDIQMNHQRELKQLRLQQERLKVELEIAQLNAQMNALKSPFSGEAKMSPEQQRANDKAACDARITALKAEKQAALKLEDEQERILKVNAIDDALQKEMERWAKLL